LPRARMGESCLGRWDVGGRLRRQNPASFDWDAQEDRFLPEAETSERMPQVGIHAPAPRKPVGRALAGGQPSPRPVQCWSGPPPTIARDHRPSRGHRHATRAGILILPLVQRFKPRGPHLLRCSVDNPPGPGMPFPGRPIGILQRLSPRPGEVAYCSGPIRTSRVG